MLPRSRTTLRSGRRSSSSARRRGEPVATVAPGPSPASERPMSASAASSRSGTHGKHESVGRDARQVLRAVDRDVGLARQAPLAGSRRRRRPARRVVERRRRARGRRGSRRGTSSTLHAEFAQPALAHDDAWTSASGERRVASRSAHRSKSLRVASLSRVP